VPVATSVLPGFAEVQANFGHGYANGPRQLRLLDEIVGGGSQSERPIDAGKTTVTSLAETGGRLCPTKHFLNALAHPPTDPIARMAGRPPIDGRSPIGGVLRDVRWSH